MNANKEVNIVLINSHRRDLIPSSCVNKEVFKFNRQLRKIMKIHRNVKLVEIDLHRKHFIRHGKNNRVIERDIRNVSKFITSSNHTKFLGLTIDRTLTWERFIENVINKLCTVCYMIGNIKPFMSVNTLKFIYYSCFHSVMTYSLISGVIRDMLIWFLKCRREL
jgi:hypothetical protein